MNRLVMILGFEKYYWVIVLLCLLYKKCLELSRKVNKSFDCTGSMNLNRVVPECKHALLTTDRRGGFPKSCAGKIPVGYKSVKEKQGPISVSRHKTFIL